MNNKLFVDIDALTNKFNAKVNGAMDKLQNFGDKATMVGGALSIAITVPVLLAARQALAAASNVEEAQNKVNVAFKTSSGVIHEFAKDSLTNFGISSGAALDAAALFGDMATSMGINTGQAAEMSKTLVGLAGDLSSFKNIGIDVAETALKSIFTGETESLKGLGIVMTEANLKAFALSEGIQKNIRDMTESEKVNLRYAFVIAKTTNAQGDFARTSDGAANQTRILEESIKQLSAGFGERLLPMYAKVLQSVNKVITYFANLDGGTKDLILLVGGLAAAFGPLLLAVSGVIKLMPIIKAGFLAMSGPIGLVTAALIIGAAAYIGYGDTIDYQFARIDNVFAKLDRILARPFSGTEAIDARIAENNKLIESYEKAKRVATEMFASPAFDFLRGGQKAFAGMGANIPTVADPKPINPLAGFGTGIDGVKKLKDLATKHDNAILDYRLRIQKSLELARSKIADAGAGISSMSSITAAGTGGKTVGNLITELFDLDSFGGNLDKRVEGIQSKIKKAAKAIGITMTESQLMIKTAKEMSMDVAFSELANGLSEGIASIFNQDIEFSFKNLVGKILSAIGGMLISIATPLVAAMAFANIATLGTMSAPQIAAVKMLGAGIAMKGGGMAMSANMNSNTGIQSPRMGGGSSGGSSGFTMPTLNLNINGVLKGNGTELQAVLNNTQYSWNG